MENLDKVLDKLHNIERNFGIAGVIFAILTGVILLGLYLYFSKAIEKAAEIASEKSLKKYQFDIDKELTKFSVRETTKHQRQIDAIQEVYANFQSVKMLIDFMIKGDKYTEGSDGHDEVALLIKRRNTFKTNFNKNRILFKIELVGKIDNLIESIEGFIDIYAKGRFPRKSPEQVEWERQQKAELDPLPGVIDIDLGGVWSQHAFDDILADFQKVSEEIESEFRAIYGV